VSVTCSRLVPPYEISPQFTVLCVTLNGKLSQETSTVSLQGVCTFIILILSNTSLSANHKSVSHITTKTITIL